MSVFIFKSLLHNTGVLFVGFLLGFLGTVLDSLFNVNNFQTIYTVIVGLIFLAIGFAIRVWATYYFYKHQMKVISLEPQKTLVTEGPFKYSRNPLYLGGNVFIFYGASLLIGTPSAMLLTTLGIPLTDLMIRREEKQLEKQFGDTWLRYKKKVRRWI